MTRLWEIDHPYYCSEGNFFKAGLNHMFNSWADFEGGFEDLDMNLLFRFDWSEEAECEDENYRNGTLSLFFILQRKGCNLSCEVSVCRADEPAVIEWLTPRWLKMKSLWDPFA